MEAFVEYVVKALVDAPEKVSLESVEKERITIIQVRCEKSDIGKIIGKSGKTIAAIRSLVSSAAGRSGLRVSVDVLD
ncbi:MAG: KH domain-containing protein [Oligosphaeraceae bacterium]|nr:KH domain-containing protein [Oligosphaeraceae bacterium]